MLFNGASVTFANALTANLDLRITATAPPDASSGPITILTPHGNVTSSVSFQVLPPALCMRLNPARQVGVSWPSPNSEFRLESMADLGGGVWTSISESPERGKGSSKLTLSAPLGTRFCPLRKE